MRSLFSRLVPQILFLVAATTLTIAANAQTSISPNNWGGSTAATSGPSTFSPLPATSVPGAAAVSVSQWNRGPGISYNAGSSRYNSRGWTTGSAGVSTTYSNGDYLYFTVTNNATTQLRITAVAIGSGQKSGTGPSTHGLLYKIGSGSVMTFDASSPGPSPSFTGSPVVLCGGETVTFYMCGWGGSSSAGTYSINSNANITAQWVTAVNTIAGSTSPVSAGTPLSFSSSPADGVSTYSYLWSGPLAYSSTEANPVISSPATSASGTYTLTVTDSWGCSAQTTTIVTVNPGSTCSGTPAAGTASAVPAAFCASGSSTISLSGYSTASGISYQWLSASSAVGPYSVVPGATSTIYNTPTVTSTTYYRCVATCGASSLSDTSSAASLTINPLPSITLSPSSASVCSGGTGALISASGAATYNWTPNTGLSASTGATITANPPNSMVYTVTGTDALGCVGTNTVSVGYGITPSGVVTAPTAVTMCSGGLPELLTATGGTVGPTTLSSGSISVSFSHGSPGFTDVIADGIPSGATITGMSVTFNVAQSSGGWNSDDIINLKAPNGKILNLINAKGGTFSTSGFVNTNISSASATPIPATGSTYTGTYAADADLGVGASGYLSDVSSWTDLYSVPNGTWELIGHYTYTSGLSIFTSWTLHIEYTYQSDISWSPLTGLYSDAAATIPYTGGATDSVYFAGSTVGTETITATAINGGCESSVNLIATVTPAPAAIGGVMSVCVGSATTLSNATSGGTWSVSNANATIGSSSGILTGIVSGTATVSYLLPSGCLSTIDVSVNPVPASIVVGSGAVCVGEVITLSSTTGGGTWSSGDATVSVGASTGNISGVSPGTASITYTASTGCYTTASVTVNSLPAAITGGNEVCEGATITLANSSSGGVWSSSNGNATVGVSSGVVTGVTAGSVVISYQTPVGCYTTRLVTVNGFPASITGSTVVCEGATTTLGTVTSGGTWSSSNTNATVGATNGIVSGVTSGTAVITYTPTTGCFATVDVTVNQTPAAISGTLGVCTGATTSLSNAIPGGVWSSTSMPVASVDAAGNVSGINAGTTTISYTLSTGCYAVAEATVNPLPAMSTGAMQVCEGSSVVLSNATSGGMWVSSDVSTATTDITGTVTGVNGGTAQISYVLVTGCYTTAEVTVNPLPTPIAGATSVCVGAAINLFNATSGGSWTSTNASVAIVDMYTGIVSGNGTGTATIYYSLPTGCRVSTTISVNPPPAAITGAANVCAGGTITLANASLSGTWSSGDASIAHVNSVTGVVTGLISGTTTIRYHLSTGCFTSRVVSVNPQPAAVTGTATVCEGGTTTFSCSTPGGVWTSGNTTVATVGVTTGNITAVSGGSAEISYSMPTGCFETRVVAVFSAPADISGTAEVCPDGTTTLSNTITGGIWSSSNTSVADISAVGLVSGFTAGVTTISYTLPTSCYKTISLVVNPRPAVYPVIGGGNYCSGGSGVSVGMAMSDFGVNYELYYSGLTAGAPVAGTGTSLSFGLQTAVGVYTVQATDVVTGCVANMSGMAMVATDPLLAPAVSVTSSMSDTVCEGTSITLTPHPVNGGTSPVYVWSVNGVTAASGSSFSYIPLDGDYVSVALSSSETCRSHDTASAARVLSVRPGLMPFVTFSVTPGDTVCEATSISATALGMNGGLTPVYSWLVNGVFSGTGTGFSFIPSDGDEISCVMESSYECRLVDSAFSPADTITVMPRLNPVVTIVATPGLTILAGQADTLTALVTDGGAAPAFQWSLNGTDIAGATTDSYVSSSFNNNDAVSVVVTSSGMCGGLSDAETVNIVVTPVTGMADVANGMLDIGVTPNPGNGNLFLSGSCPTAVASVTVSLIDMAGRTVYSNIIFPQNGVVSEHIYLSNILADGVYMLNLNSKEGSRQFKLIVSK